MTSYIKDYEEALSRLVARGEKVNLDTVAVEAGRKRGSIKRSRPAFEELIQKIELAAKARDGAAVQAPATQDAKGMSVSASSALGRLKNAQAQKKEVERLLAESRARELSAIMQIRDLKGELAAIRGGGAIPLGRKNKPAQ